MICFSVHRCVDTGTLPPLTSRLGILWIYALEAIGFVVRRQPATADGDYRKTLRRTQPDAVPSVPRDGTAGDVRHAMPVHTFVDVRVPLEDRKHVVPHEELGNLRGVHDIVSVVGPEALLEQACSCRSH